MCEWEEKESNHAWAVCVRSYVHKEYFLPSPFPLHFPQSHWVCWCLFLTEASPNPIRKTETTLSISKEITKKNCQQLLNLKSKTENKGSQSCNCRQHHSLRQGSSEPRSWKERPCRAGAQTSEEGGTAQLMLGLLRSATRQALKSVGGWGERTAGAWN